MKTYKVSFLGWIDQKIRAETLEEAEEIALSNIQVIDIDFEIEDSDSKEKVEKK